MDRNYVIMVCVIFVVMFGGMAYEDHTKSECRVAAINNHLDAEAVKNLCK